MERKIVAVIGGGASGMMAAVAAAEQGAFVTLFETNERVGKKLLATGNGKCNFSNLRMDHSSYFSKTPEKVETYMQRFGVIDTVQFFQSQGMMTKDKNGYLYPASEQATTVLDIFRILMKKLKISILTDKKVSFLCKEETSEKIVLSAGGEKYFFDSVVVACGSKAAPKTGSDGNGYVLAEKIGHHIHEVVPALVQLKCEERHMKSVSGVRAEGKVSLLVDGKETSQERGEIQFTDYGISGIVVFQISRTAAYALIHKKKTEVLIDLLPDMNPDVFDRFIIHRKKSLGNGTICTVEEFFTGMLNKKLMQYFIRKAGLGLDEMVGKVSEEKLDLVFAFCKNWKLRICGTNSFDQAQVCAGGVSLTEVDENLQSLKLKGIYFAGEILDVDGKCGGYNLQWAWTSGKIAGESAAR